MKYAVIAFTVFLITLRSLLMKAASDREHSLPQTLVIFFTAAVTPILTALARGFSLHGSTVVIALAFDHLDLIQPKGRPMTGLYRMENCLPE